VFDLLLDSKQMGQRTAVHSTAIQMQLSRGAASVTIRRCSIFITSAENKPETASCNGNKV
jgi:hypothetical protein